MLMIFLPIIFITKSISVLLRLPGRSGHGKSSNTTCSVRSTGQKIPVKYQHPNLLSLLSRLGSNVHLNKLLKEQKKVSWSIKDHMNRFELSYQKSIFFRFIKWESSSTLDLENSVPSKDILNYRFR